MTWMLKKLDRSAVLITGWDFSSLAFADIQYSYASKKPVMAIDTPDRRL